MVTHDQLVVKVLGRDAVIIEGLDEAIGGGLDRAKGAAVVEHDLYPVTGDDQLLDFAVANVGGHLLQGDLLRAAEAPAQPQLQPQDHRKDGDDPDPGRNCGSVLVRLFIHSSHYFRQATGAGRRVADLVYLATNMPLRQVNCINQTTSRHRAWVAYH